MKRQLKYLLATMIILLNIIIPSISFAQGDSLAYVIPIRGDINRATKNYVRDIVNEVNSRNDVEVVIFEIDTFGGLIDQANEIKDIIIGTDAATISFVNNKAESAGVLITIASEKVVMSRTATIGSAETIPNTEKVMSLWRAWLRDTAQFRGRDPLIIEAMADKDIEIPGIIEKGKLLNLTSQEARELEISDFTADNYEDILAEFGYEGLTIVEKSENLQVRLAKFISNPYLSSFILTMAFVGLVIEIMTPGFGVGGTISIIGFSLYFGGNILAGNSNWTSVALFLAGSLLLLIEVIVPGFGFPGISGIILVGLGIVLAVDSIAAGLFSVGIALIATIVVAIILFKFGFRNTRLSSIVLTSSLKTDRGYTSSDSKAQYLNKRGVAVTELRPSGYIEVEGERLDALSSEGYIPKNTLIEVIKVEGSKILVRRV